MKKMSRISECKLEWESACGLANEVALVLDEKTEEVVQGHLAKFVFAPTEGR